MRFHVIVLLLGAVCAAVCPGCAKSKEAPSDGVVVAGRQAQATVSAPVGRTAQIAREVLSELNLSVVQYRMNPTEAEIVAYTPSSQRLEVDVRRNGASTLILVRGEASVDERLAVSIVNAIRKRL